MKLLKFQKYLEDEDDVDQLARDFYWKRNPDRMMAENSRPDMVIGFVAGHNKAREKCMFTEEHLLGFLNYYNSFDLNKSEYRYKYPTMDGSEKVYNNNINRKILAEYIQSIQSKLPIGFELRRNPSIIISGQKRE
jgi:hypothetical protein